jgi:hypothetical protein
LQNGYGIYFTLLWVNGKQIKHSPKTEDQPQNGRLSSGYGGHGMKGGSAMWMRKRSEFVMLLNSPQACNYAGLRLLKVSDET